MYNRFWVGGQGMISIELCGFPTGSILLLPLQSLPVVEIYQTTTHGQYE
jgi:hypothetical protein